MCLIYVVSGLVFMILLLAPCVAVRKSPAMRCENHPAFSNSWNPVLVSSWENHGRIGFSDATQDVYLPRYKAHGYEPYGEPGSEKYMGLDLFYPGRTNGPALRMFFQRPAKVYLFLDVGPGNFNPRTTAKLKGWKSEGWAIRTKGTATFEYGIYNRLKRMLGQYTYVFSKSTGSRAFVDVLSNADLLKKVKPLQVLRSYTLWIAESDGSASPSVGFFAGKAVEANKRCPDSLHDSWVVEDKPGDPDTRGQFFKTWHPKYDPCFWCAYDHEHGSSAKELMGYVPKFDLTAWKNNRQRENHPGFKCFVFRQRTFLIYYSLHMQTSNMNRLKSRLHTVVLAVVHQRTKELLAEMSYKADLGFLAARLKDDVTWVPLDDGEAAIQKSQGRGPDNFRSVAVVDKGDKDPQFSLREPYTLGTYEFWRTFPMCTRAVGGLSGIAAVVRTPATGIKSPRTRTKVELGRYKDGVFYQSSSLDRSLRIPRLKISAQFCPGGSSGTFFTDATGKTVLPGPGKGSVRQFIKPGLSLEIGGNYEPLDGWVGMYAQGARGTFVDHGFGIDPRVN